MGFVDEAKIEATIDLIRDERELWTPFGIASLSKSHRLFGQGENYWRGPIWVQMNFMVLKALRGYSQGEGELAQKAAKVYGELRTNVVKNVFEVRFCERLAIGTKLMEYGRSTKRLDTCGSSTMR